MSNGGMDLNYFVLFKYCVNFVGSLWNWIELNWLWCVVRIGDLLKFYWIL